ncbi:MAG TPA: hypothetical protein PLI62_00360 [Spirochaetota bacterium]|jgi:hypothetical protein|nr:hypothetical protein [Spirochaetota bacterium]
MKLRAIKIDRRFVPEWNKNKKLPPAEQVVIHFNRIPGTTEKMSYKGFSFKQGGAVELSYNDNMLVAAFVQKVENLELSDGTKIKDGKDLATLTNPLISGLITEIRDYLFPDDEDMTEGEPSA